MEVTNAYLVHRLRTANFRNNNNKIQEQQIVTVLSKHHGVDGMSPS